MNNKDKAAFARRFYTNMQPGHGVMGVIEESQKGITKLEYFAGMFIQGMLANPTICIEGGMTESQFNNITNDAIGLAEKFLSLTDQ